MSRYWILGCLLIASQGWAKGLSPYLPLQISPEIESQIEKVMALTPGAPLTKPYKAADVMRRNKLIASRFPELHRSVDAYLARFKDTLALTHVSASVSAGEDESSPIPNQRGIKRNSSYQVSASGVAFISPYAYVAGGAVYADGEDAVLYNTHVAFGYEYAQIEAGYREHWFSPMQDSALLSSTNAKPSVSVTLSNATPITDWDIRYEVFYAKLDDTIGISQQGELFNGEPNLLGLHLSISPVEAWTIGYSRTLKYAGANNNLSIGDAFQDLFSPSGEDTPPSLNPQALASDQKTAISSKINLPFAFPVSVYGELAFDHAPEVNEQETDDKALAFGVYFPMVTNNISLRYEFTRLDELFYQSGFYTAGYTNEGQALGHWAGDLFLLQEQVQKTTHSLNMNWRFASDQVIDVTLRTADGDSNSNAQQAFKELTVRYSYATQYGFWGLDLDVGEDRFGEQFKRVSAFYRW
ncbi:capsule assembly Wzi family protein [Paraglaciecola chathamensis]|jgi:hypothetical protein|uniref:Capsule assembly Wzi family protein n=1 Tax=Paraglaciecola chathamensis TaxID=368405 RepID=A0A8H9I6R2_9ALTE|nr:capsule assembly Wzi family protein [Paraglaciecola oceanifecundans]GGZ51088.1 hypothetical protein GCM10011274_06220 [Paraglaciecola oceanifecundans]